MLIALRFHLFDAIRVIATRTFSLEQVNPAYWYCGLAIVLNFIKDFYWPPTLTFFFLGIQNFVVNLGDIRVVYQDFVSLISITFFFTNQ